MMIVYSVPCVRLDNESVTVAALDISPVLVKAAPPPSGVSESEYPLVACVKPAGLAQVTVNDLASTREKEMELAATAGGPKEEELANQINIS